VTGPVTSLFGAEPDGDANYPGSKKVKRSVSGVSTDPWDDLPSVEFEVHGVPTLFYGVGVLAQMLGRKPQTIRKWENAGYFPRSRFRYPGSSSANNRREGQRRLYTRDEIEGVVAIAKSTGVLDPHGRGSNVGSTAFPAQTRALFESLSRRRATP
jgi:hypothetical protein